MEFIDERIINNVTFLVDEAGHEFGRICGGVGWKGKRPGFIVAVAEDLEPDATLNTFHRHIIGEYETDDSLKLLNKILEFRTCARINPWLADTDDAISMEFLARVNQDINYRDILRIERAPNCDDTRSFEFCLNTIESLLNPDKLLHFKESRVVEYLAEINQENRDTLTVKDYPAIVALGSALAYLREHPVNPYDNPDDHTDEERDAKYDYQRGCMP